MKTATMLAALALLGLGCDNNHLLGAVDGGPPPSQDSGPPPGMDGGLDVPMVGPLGGAQSWTGYVENYQFTSGSDAVKIAFASDSPGTVVGAVILGNGTPPPPATDPNVGYPPGFGNGQPFVIGSSGYVAEGYAYTMRNGTLVGRRLHFGVSLQELWRDWCALQTPFPGSGSCLPNWGGMYIPGSGCSQTNPDTHEVVPVDCGKFSLCDAGGMVCLCDASVCKVNDDNIDMTFDVMISGDLADGSVSGGHNVHFTKDP